MPLFEFCCPTCAAHVETIRPIDRRDAPMACSCGAAMARVEIAASHVPPDGVYSYAPNIGDPERFERQRQAIRDGVRVIDRQPSQRDLELRYDPPRPKGTFFGYRSRA
jgi:hypothetical protein